MKPGDLVRIKTGYALLRCVSSKYLDHWKLSYWPVNLTNKKSEWSEIIFLIVGVDDKAMTVLSGNTGHRYDVISAAQLPEDDFPWTYGLEEVLCFK